MEIKNHNANYMAYGYAETLIKPYVFIHPGGSSGLRRTLRPAGGLRPAWRANLGPAGGLDGGQKMKIKNK